MKIKRNQSFCLFAYGKEKNKYQIRLRVTFCGERLDLATGCQLSSKSAWDHDSESVKSGYTGPKGETALTINNELRNIKDQMDTVFKYFEVNEILPTRLDVATKYKERIVGVAKNKTVQGAGNHLEKTKNLSLFEVYDLFTHECGEKNAWTKATYEKMAAMRVDLQNFKKDLKFSDLTENTLTSFISYLRDNKRLRTPRKAKGDREDYDLEDITGLKNSTIEKKLGYFRWFMNWATDKGYNNNLAYKSFHPTLKRTQKKVIYLTPDEMNQIVKLELVRDKAYLEPIRDVFLFCCFSGLRHSDVSNLKRSDIKGNHIEITTVKTADSVSIELNDITSEILMKYAEVPFRNNKALPSYTNQAMNRDVKELCRLAEINEEIRITSYKGNVRTDEVYPKWQLVGTHTGRRTFIVNALSLGIPPDVVMKWTGHNDYKAMKPYIDIVDRVKVNAMTKFNHLL